MSRAKKIRDQFPTAKRVADELKKPKSKTRLTFDICLVVIVIGVIGLIIFENSRHARLQASAETLADSVFTQGFGKSKVGTSCDKGSRGKTVTHFHQCTLGFTYNVQKISITDANNIIEKANRSVSGNADFNRRPTDLLASIDANGRGLRDPSILLMHKSTGKECTLYYSSDSAYSQPGEVEFTLKLICDDDSWFGKTFL